MPFFCLRNWLKFNFVLKFIVSISIACVMLGCEATTHVDLTQNITYDQFSGTYTLSNNNVVVVIAPNIGRVIGYHRVGEPNLLWLNAVPTESTKGTWVNYGGDKVWLAPDGLWGEILGRTWPPEVTTDGLGWTVTYADKKKLIMTSMVSRQHAARLTRTFTLPDNDTTLRIDHLLERTATSKFPVEVWTVTQIPLPEYCLLSVTPERPDYKGILQYADGITFEPHINECYALYRWPKETWSKVGTYGRWVAGVFEKNIFVQYSSLDVTADYYDHANCEIYANQQLGYVELENLSPTQFLLSGESMSFHVIWKILPREAGMDLQNILDCIKANAD